MMKKKYEGQEPVYVRHWCHLLLEQYQDRNGDCYWVLHLPDGAYIGDDEYLLALRGKRLVECPRCGQLLSYRDMREGYTFA